MLQDRTTTGTAEWLGQHPEVEIVSRDRCGLYAQGARVGASQARQVADRFHLLQNLRETIEAQLSRVDRSTGRALLPEANDEGVAAIASGPGGRRDLAEHRCLTRQAHRRSRQAIFDQNPRSAAGPSARLRRRLQLRQTPQDTPRPHPIRVHLQSMHIAAAKIHN
jgi:transposase